MSPFHIVSESTEDTLATADSLQDAVRAAREAARQGPAGELISILESGGKAIRQFVLLPDGMVTEQPVAAPAKAAAAIVPEPNLTEPTAATDGARNAG